MRITEDYFCPFTSFVPFIKTRKPEKWRENEALSSISFPLPQISSLEHDVNCFPNKIVSSLAVPKWDSTFNWQSYKKHGFVLTITLNGKFDLIWLMIKVITNLNVMIFDSLLLEVDSHFGMDGLLHFARGQNKANCMKFIVKMPDT